MKCFSFGLLFFASVVSAEWIEPPARSAKGYLVPVPDYNPLFPKTMGSSEIWIGMVVLGWAFGNGGVWA